MYVHEVHLDAFFFSRKYLLLSEGFIPNEKIVPEHALCVIFGDTHACGNNMKMEEKLHLKSRDVQ